MDGVNRRLFAANVAGLALNAVLAAVLAVGLAGEESSSAGAGATIARVGEAQRTGGDGPPPPPPSDGPERTARFLDDTVSPIQRAIADMGGTADVLPTAAQLDAAKASGTLSSDASRVVIDQLRLAYEKYNMPFPVMPDASGPSNQTSPRADAPAATTTDGGEGDILRAYFTVTRMQVETAASAAGVDIGDTLPTLAQVDAAIASGDIGSEQSRVVLTLLRAAHERAGVAFREPVVR